MLQASRVFTGWECIGTIMSLPTLTSLSQGANRLFYRSRIYKRLTETALIHPPQKRSVRISSIANRERSTRPAQLETTRALKHDKFLSLSIYHLPPSLRRQPSSSIQAQSPFPFLIERKKEPKKKRRRCRDPRSKRNYKGVTNVFIHTTNNQKKKQLTE